MSLCRFIHLKMGLGRVSLLILNAILLKYAAIVVRIGEHDDSRAE
jgi:hypothetical protein